MNEQAVFHAGRARAAYGGPPVSKVWTGAVSVEENHRDQEEHAHDRRPEQQPGHEVVLVGEPARRLVRDGVGVRGHGEDGEVHHEVEVLEIAAGMLVKNLAAVHLERGEYKEAETLYQRSLTDTQAAVGSEDPHVAFLLRRLSDVQLRLGKFTEAASALERALAIEEKTLGKDNPRVVIYTFELAEIHREIGNYKKSEELHLKAISAAETALGPRHPRVFRMTTSLAELYREWGKPDKAIAVYEGAITRRREMVADDAGMLERYLEELATTYSQNGLPEKAAPLLRQRVALAETLRGEKDPDTVLGFKRLADLHAQQGHHKDAEKFYKRGLASARQAFASDNETLGHYLRHMSKFYVNEGKGKKAAPLAREAKELLEPSTREPADVPGPAGPAGPKGQ